MYINPCELKGQSSDCPLVTHIELERLQPLTLRVELFVTAFTLALFTAAAYDVAVIEQAIHVLSLVVAYTVISVYAFLVLSLLLFIILRRLEPPRVHPA
jgi:hypothetical protein